MEYVDVSRVEALYDKQTIGAKLSISLNREITNDEKNEFSRIVQEVVGILRRNSVLADPMEQEEAESEKQSLLACFGDNKVYVKEIENEYEGKRATRPWFLVYTKKGPISIGWRKRVIKIDWTDSDIQQTAKELFWEEMVPGTTNTQVTMYHKSIHAWGYDKAASFITTLLES